MLAKIPIADSQLEHLWGFVWPQAFRGGLRECPRRRLRAFPQAPHSWPPFTMSSEPPHGEPKNRDEDCGARNFDYASRFLYAIAATIWIVGIFSPRLQFGRGWLQSKKL